MYSKEEFDKEKTKVLKYISLNDCGGHYDAISGCPRFFVPSSI